MARGQWTKAALIAASGALATAPAAAEEGPKTETYDIRAEWLDPAVVDHPKAHDRIIAELANSYPVMSRNLDDLGLTNAAARAFAEARNTGDLHLKLYETDREWWQRKQPELEQIMDDYRTREINRSLTVLGTMGTAGVGLAGVLAWKSRRRRKEKAADASAPTPGGGPKA
ncbi:MAG: hypothetical protein AAF556_06025 [Pseudomonadota bacterium]